MAADEKKQLKASRVREGYVVSDKMDKTRVVSVTRVLQHPRFKKVIKRQIRYAFHDEHNESKVGDKVAIVETRPVSKNKRWRLKQVLVAA